MLLWLVIAYLAVSIAIGLYGASKVHNAKDYVTAGRNLPFAIVLVMVLIVLAIGHMLAALKHLLIDKDGIFNRIWFGKSP